MTSQGPKELSPQPSQPSTEAGNGGLDSVSLICRILDELARGPTAMGVSDIGRALGETKARVHRNLVALKQGGLVDQESDTERYRLGWKLLQLGERAALQFDIRALAEPLLKRLRDATGQSALLSVPLNGEALVVATANDDSNVSITVKHGNRPLPHCSAQGRIALAWAEDAMVRRVLSGKLAALTPHSLVDPAKLRTRLDRIRERLYEEAPNESLIGINVLAAPIFRDGERLVGIIGVIGSVQHVHSPPDPEQLRLVQGYAAQLSSAFGSGRYRDLGVGFPSELCTASG